MNSLQDLPNYDPKTKRFPWGCLIGGCATVLLLMIGLTVGTGVVVFYAYKGQISKYTSDSPKELPAIKYSEDEIKEVAARVESVKSSLDKGEVPKAVELTADDLNALINQQEGLQGKLFVRIDEGKVTADVSFPADIIPMAKGRYFNGSVSANVSLDDGDLVVILSDAEVNGQKIPKEIMDALKKENLAEELYKNPKIRKILDKFERLQIEKDRIILTPKLAVEPLNAPEKTP